MQAEGGARRKRRGEPYESAEPMPQGAWMMGAAIAAHHWLRNLWRSKMKSAIEPRDSSKLF